MRGTDVEGVLVPETLDLPTYSSTMRGTDVWYQVELSSDKRRKLKLVVEQQQRALQEVSPVIALRFAAAVWRAWY